jgi:hypothetical protein
MMIYAILLTMITILPSALLYYIFTGKNIDDHPQLFIAGHVYPLLEKFEKLIKL